MVESGSAKRSQSTTVYQPGGSRPLSCAPSSKSGRELPLYGSLENFDHFRLPTSKEMVAKCHAVTARQITTIFMRHPTKKRSRNASPLQPGNFRPFPIPLHQTFGRKMPRCRSLANCDHSHMPPSYKTVGNCCAAIAWHFPTIPAHLHANKRSKYTALPQSSAFRQNAKWERPPSRSAIGARPQIRPRRLSKFGVH